MSLSRRMLTTVIGSVAAIALTIGLVPAAHAEDAVGAAQKDLTQLQIEAAEVQRNLEASKQAQVNSQRQYDLTTEDLADQRTLVEAMRTQVGRVAVAAHQQAAGLGTAKLLFTSDSEDSFLADIAVMQSITSITDEQMIRLAAEQSRLTELETTQAAALQKVTDEVAQQTELAAEYDKKVASAQQVVNRLTEAQKAALADAQNAVSAAYEKGKRDAEQTSKRVVADLRAGNLVLRNRWAVCEANLGVPTATPAPSEPDAGAGDREESAGRIIQAAAQCDAQVNGLQELLTLERQGNVQQPQPEVGARVGMLPD